MRTTTTLVVAVAALAPCQARGQQPDTTRVHAAPPITVTADRPRTTPPPPVFTIDVPGVELHRTLATNPYDLISRTTGIEIHQQGQGPGFASDAVIAGFTSDHSSDILFTLDGVPLNLPLHGHAEGYADWSAIPAIALSSVRVIHGPASPRYGDFAFGGVVEAFTAPDATGTIGSITSSSFGDVELGLRTGQRQDRRGFMIGAVAQRHNGWRDNSNYLLGTGIARGWVKTGNSSRLEGGLLSYGSDFNSPGFASVSRFNADQLEAATDGTDGGSARRTIGTLRFSTRPGSSTRLEILGWGQSVRSTVFLNIPEDGAVAQTEEEDRRTAAGGRAEFTINTGLADAVTLGLTGRADDIGYDLYNTEARVRKSHRTDLDGTHYSAAAYGRYRKLIASQLLLDVGGRVDYQDNRSRNNLFDSGTRAGAYTLFSPKLGARFLLGARTMLFASVSRGFRGAPGTINAPDREPMIAWAKQLGARYDAPGLTLKLALFRFDVDNERIMNPVTREISERGTSRRQGINAEVEWNLSNALNLSLEGTYNDAKITGVDAASALVVNPLVANSLVYFHMHDEPLTPGADVPGVAEYHGRLRLEGSLTELLSHHFTLRFSGPFTPIGEPTVKTQPYAIADVGAAIRLPSINGTLDLTLQNVLDSDYPEVRASGFINPGNPRVLRVGLYLGASLIQH